ncbi:Uncharacterised protein [Legionella wadsworthii]|uniref:Transmembrane protein n=1 Tax=Legionella wadsworthii TaxID=28088 RepID=A0A378LXK3_9GAMM|nr:hypothetical protein [Legionella wadsworthii]STY31237.1 Uncharacterised protein [Legionella wadsworthii]
MNTPAQSISPISWTALFSGALAGVGLNFLLNLLALTIGLCSFSITASGETNLSLWGFGWFILFSLISMFTTGWVAGALSPKILKRKLWGLLIGFLSWSILLIFIIVLLTNMIQYASFHSNFTSNLVEVKIRNDSPMLTETKAHRINNSPLTFNIETHKKIITLNAFLTFLLFFTGALSSSIGGLLGYQMTPKLKRVESIH